MAQKRADKFRSYIFSRLIQLTNDMKIKQKLILSYIIVFIIPVVLLSSFLLEKANIIIIDQSTSSYKSSLTQLSGNIDNKLYEYEDIANYLYLNSILNGLLHREYEYPVDIIDASDSIRELLVGYTKYRSDIRRVLIYFTNDTLYSPGVYLMRMTPEQAATPEFKKISSAGIKGYWSESRYINLKNNYWDKDEYSSKISNAELIYTYNRPMNFQYTGSFKDILTLEVRENSLYALIKEDSRDKDIYLINDNGIVITSNKRELVGKKLENSYLLSKVTEANGEFDINNANSRERAIYRTLHNGWRVISVIPLNNLLKQTKNLQFISLVFIAICIVIAVLIILLLSELLVRRLNVLLKKIQHMKQGTFDIKQSIGGKDEFAILDRNFSEMADRIKLYINEVYILNLKKKEAELAALQAQINPHFLYNTLSAINWMTVKNTGAEIREFVENIANFYRISLSKGKEVIPIREEVQCVRSYLEIQRYRTMNRVKPYFNISSDIMDVPTVKLVLQPIVENSIEHGCGEENQEIAIAIRGYRTENRVILEVEDNGIGIEPARLMQLQTGQIESKTGSGYGLMNVNQRIKLRFGEQYGLDISSTPGKGTTVRILLPY